MGQWDDCGVVVRSEASTLLGSVVVAESARSTSSPPVPQARAVRNASVAKDVASRTEPVTPLRGRVAVITGAASGVDGTTSSTFRPLIFE